MTNNRSSRRIFGTIAVAACVACDVAYNTEAFMPQSSTSTSTTLQRKIKNIDPLNVYTSPEQEGIQAKDGNNAFLEKLSEKIGQVDESRLIYPEYDNGEVTRMFSALTYSKSEQGETIRAERAKTGSVVSAAALIAGTMIGTGILALPAATVPAGFLPSTAAMCIGWLYMTMSGLLIAELSINRMVQSGRPGQGMLALYHDILGPKASIVGSIAYFFLHYAVMVAYIAQGGNNMESFFSSVLPSVSGTEGLGQITFAGATGLGLYAASQSQVEKLNNGLVLVLAAAFAGIIGLGSGTADFGSIIDLSNQHPEMVASAFPIIFLSLAYQNVVPTIVNQLEGDRKKITTSIISGTTLPALLLILWNAVILGNLQPEDVANSGLNPVALLQSIDPGNPVLGGLVGAFSSIAVVTTLTGFVYGLLDAWTDAFNVPRDGPDFEEKWKLPFFALIFAPPLAFSVLDPDIFYNALDFGGAFGVSTLFLVLPPFMVWSQRYGDDEKPLMTKPLGKLTPYTSTTKSIVRQFQYSLTLLFLCLITFTVPFGKLALGSMWKAAGTLILEQGAEKLGVFDWIGENIMHSA